MLIATKRRAFGAALRNFRDQRGLTLRDLGRDSGVSFRCLGLIESGERGVGPDYATRIASALHLEGEKRAQFLKRAATTLTERGRNRVTTGCPPHLAQIFSQHLAFVLRTDLAKIDAFGCIQFPSLSAFPEAGVPAPTLHYACERGGKVAPLKPAVLEHIESHKAFPLLLIVFLRNGKQVVVQCGARAF